eukprot:CAMPEP_0116140642 /NCGR_PEP_ID=MMETSP0329-20121206/13964_1 /TAXON_ID=697910 /ORGANISM="Pseudo-nitzschia arenysensis, Strain B593" /LENGTH=391 /DNA_ID=CAMNT_0003635785 /DNA_START=146 /DNA_END=1321 /DNA_ORIENTATION=+
MLSLASRRTTTSITRHHQMLRRTTENAKNSLVRQQRSRLSTTAASSTTKQQEQPLVISRRAWLEFKETRGIKKKRPDPSKRPKSDDEKPWPKSVQIAGYVAGTVAVPYIILWTITSNPTLREWFSPYIPLEKLRPYFGKLEWDAQNFSEEMENVKNKEKNQEDATELNDYYQFPEEEPCKTRRQQELVEAINGSDISVTLSLQSSSTASTPDEVVTKSIAANTVANPNTLLEYFPSASSSVGGNTTVAVDFLDRKNEDSDVNSFNAGETTDGTLMTDADSLESNGSFGTSAHDLASESRQLGKDTQTSSRWAYVAMANGSTQKDAKTTSSPPQISETDIEIGRLEYEISELEKNLRDPMCTRSIDDMTTELRQAKKDLSRLKWRRRLGFGR